MDRPQLVDCVVAAIVTLVRCEVVDWHTLCDSLRSFFQNIEDLTLDCPHIDGLATSLFAGLLMLEVNKEMLEALPTSEPGIGTLRYCLLMVSLKKVGRLSGAATVARIVEDRRFVDVMAQASNVSC